MELTSKHKQQLRSLAHGLKPVVLIGAHGLTQAVQLEIHRALEDHELIKVKIGSQEREARQAIAQAIIEEQHATLIQSIGQIITLYRVSQKHQGKAVR